MADLLAAALLEAQDELIRCPPIQMQSSGSNCELLLCDAAGSRWQCREGC